MSLAKFSVRQPILVNLLAIGVVAAGAIAMTHIPRESTPAVPMGAAQIFAPYLGASAEEVEALVGLPLESAVRGLSNVSHVYTTSREGMAMLWVEFEPNTPDVSRAVMRVQAAVDRVGDYPADAERPQVVERTVMLPTLSVAVTSGDRSASDLRAEVAELRQALLQLDGVSAVRATGIGERAVYVDADPARLAAHHLPIESLAEALGPRASDVPAGVVHVASQARLVRGVARVVDPEEVAAVVVRAHPPEALVRVGDVADVRAGALPPPITARVDGEPGVLLMVHKRDEGDSLRISAAVHALLQRARWSSSGVRTRVVGDLAPEVAQSLSSLYENAGLGLVLVLLLLWVFVGGRNALMTALGLPVALAAAVAAMHTMGVTLNSLSLMALILCLGVIVDDAIILVENIYRHMEAGMPRMKAAVVGTEEVMMPVVASTITTCAAFAPLFFLEGVFGEFFSIIPKVVVAALVGSLAEALVVLPSHMADFGQGPATKERPQTRLERTAARLGASSKAIYLRWLDSSLRRPGLVVVGAYAVCAALVVLAVTTKRVVLLNDGDVDAIDVRVRMPADANRAATERLMDEVDARLIALGSDDVAEVQSTVGYTRTDTWTVTGDHVGMSALRLVDPSLRSAPDAGQQLLARVRDILSDLVGPERVQVTAFEPGPPRSAAFTLRVSGRRHEDTVAAAEDVIAALRRIPGVREVAHDAGLGKVAVSVRPDEERCAHHGLRVADVVRWLRLSLGENVVARTRDGDEVVSVVLGLAEDTINDPSQLGQLRLMTPSGDHVALSEVATLDLSRSTATLRRRDGRDLVQVTADVDGRVTTTDQVATALSASLPSLEASHDAVGFSVGGELERVGESLRSLAEAFVIAALLIYAILATQFQSLSHPLVVMAAIPLSLIGVVVGFFVTQQPVGIIALVGVVGLAGIVVNDSLVLVEFINQRRAEGRSRDDAVREAAALRLRPILVTSITTVAGLLPLAFASGSAPLLAPMAAAISWGLTFATGLTLIAVPCLYVVVDRWASRLKPTRSPLPTPRTSSPG